MSKNRYQYIKNLLNEAVLVLNSDREICDTNNFFMNLIGCYDRAEVIGSSADQFLTAKDIVLLKDFIREFNDPEPHVSETYNFTLVSHPIPFRLIGFSVGKEIEILMLSTINEKKLQMLNFQYTMLLDSLPGSIYWKDRDGHYMGCNRFVLEMAGFNKHSEIIGKTDYELCWRQFADEWAAADNKVLLSEKSLILEEKVKLSSGKILTELTHKSPLKDQDGNIIGTIGASLDITELKETQAKLKKADTERKIILRRYQQFIDDQEHDIRLPVGGVVSGATILQSLVEDVSEEALEWATDIKCAASQILEYQESLLYDLFQGTRKGKTIFARFDLSELLTRIYELYKPVCKAKQIDFIQDYDSNIPAYLKGDAKRIYQCLVDLVSNAVRFTNTGSVTMSVKLLNTTKQKAVVRFSIVDTGIGIPEDKQREIYEEFVKVAPSNATSSHGRGLGLSRVQHLVDLMQGELWLESKVAKGSCFNMTLPLSISIDQCD